MAQYQFVLFNPLLAGLFSFEGYNNQKGELQYIAGGKDTNGEDVAKFFRWQSRTFSTNNERIADFLRKAPFCEGSPNAMRGEAFFYKELNPEGEATKDVNKKILETKAMNLAIGLKDEKLREIAILCGTYSTSAAIQKQRIYDVASNDPEGFIDLVGSVDSEVKALIRVAQERGIIQLKNNFMFMWQDVHLGNSEEEAIAKLMSDEILKDALKKAYESQQPKVNSNVATKAPGKQDHNRS